MADSPDCAYQRLAARYVRRQAKQLTEQLEGARTAEDIEFIHRARVASRRLRAALRMFRSCFDSKQVKRWRKQIRRVTEGLGDARDKDVQIEFLSSVLCDVTDKSCSMGIARLLAQLEHEREQLQDAVIKAVDRLESSSVLGEMLAATKPMLDGAKETEAEDYGQAARELTERYILRRMEEMLSYQDSLADPGDQKRHHAMRIAAKRLRYTTEISKPVYQGRLDATVNVIKKLQTLLGDIHDCDVWAHDVDCFAEEERKRLVARFGHAARFSRLQPGIEYLRRDRVEHRRQVFDELVRYWGQLKGEGFWDQLALTVTPCGGKTLGGAVLAGQPAPAGENGKTGQQHGEGPSASKASDHVPRPHIALPETRPTPTG